MNNVVIRAENLGKSYFVGHNLQSDRYVALRDVVASNAKYLVRKTADMLAGKPLIQGDKIEEFWALKDLNFEIKQGDRVGIIGSNGAGKSTLLKILSRITEPTKGVVTLSGRVASLLEVGTGFHPELTGRENIFLNGAILGMKRPEILKKFDEIVEFAGVEKFIDTPVKRYSSGMQVRLAFAVAAHLEPEILIVDEVLAVGDASFQKKCLSKMESFGKDGRTIVFVSHQLDTVRHLCTRVLLLENGNLLPENSNVSQSIKSYIAGSSDGSSVWENSGSEFEYPEFTPIKFWIGDKLGEPILMPAENSQGFWIHIKGEIKEEASNLVLGYFLLNEFGDTVYVSTMIDTAVGDFPIIVAPAVHLKSYIPGHFLNEGKYRIQLWAHLYGNTNLIGAGTFWEPPTISLHIEGGLSDSPFWERTRDGVMAPMLDWINHE